CNIPLKDGIFNAVFCIGVIHHIPDMHSALRELKRVITISGMLIIGVYSPTSAGAHLKSAYDATNINVLKKLIFYGATVLIWAKLRRHLKLSWKDARKRIVDLLETPVVRYLSAEYYENMGSQAGLKTVARRQI